MICRYCYNKGHLPHILRLSCADGPPASTGCRRQGTPGLILRATWPGFLPAAGKAAFSNQQDYEQAAAAPPGPLDVDPMRALTLARKDERIARGPRDAGEDRQQAGLRRALER
jgi:hypothetical protein